MTVTVIPIVTNTLGTVLKCLERSPNHGNGTGRAGNWRTNRCHSNYSKVEIDQNTEKSPGDLMILAVT